MPEEKAQRGTHHDTFFQRQKNLFLYSFLFRRRFFRGRFLSSRFLSGSFFCGRFFRRLLRGRFLGSRFFGDSFLNSFLNSFFRCFPSATFHVYTPPVYNIALRTMCYNKYTSGHKKVKSFLKIRYNFFADGFQIVQADIQKAFPSVPHSLATASWSIVLTLFRKQVTIIIKYE